MVRFELWDQHGVGNKLLCVDCLEHRVGRPLVPADMLDCALNSSPNQRRCTKLQALCQPLVDRDALEWARALAANNRAQPPQPENATNQEHTSDGRTTE